jgi:hypothetical protein
MAREDLSEEEREEMARLLRQAIEVDRYAPYPAPKPSAEPSLLYHKLKGGKRRR